MTQSHTQTEFEIQAATSILVAEQEDEISDHAGKPRIKNTKSRHQWVQHERDTCNQAHQAKRKGAGTARTKAKTKTSAKERKHGGHNLRELPQRELTPPQVNNSDIRFALFTLPLATPPPL